MKRFLKEEKGASQLIEGAVIFPIMFVVIFLLMFFIATFLQKALLQYHATRLSDYIAKTILFPGYENVQSVYYSEDPPEINIDEAMKNIDPYRYLFGLFSSDYSKNRPAIEHAKSYYINYIKKSGVYKPSNKRYVFSDPEFSSKDIIVKQDGYILAIKASSSKVTVYIGQPYVFSRMFEFIGLGEKARTMSISGKASSFINDNVEFIRTIDMAFDVTADILDATGISGKISEFLAKFKK